MLIDLRMEGKTALIFGGGILGERKAKKLLQHGPQVIVVSRSFTEGLDELEQQGKIELVEGDAQADFGSFSSLISRADIVIAATDNPQLNTDIAKAAGDMGTLVCVVDMPSISDFYSPAVAQRGSIRVGVCTDGKSPLMSKLLRERIEVLITEEDVLQVELQSFAREIVKDQISVWERRREILYRIAQDQTIKRFLKEGNLSVAKNYAKQIIKSY